MEKPTKSFLLGIASGVLILGLGYLSYLQDDSKLNELVERCKAEATHTPKGPWLKWQKAPLVCEPPELSGLGMNELTGIQKEIAGLHLKLGRTFETSKIITVFVIIFFSLPYAWYFLLRRIKELRNSLTGK